MMVSNPDSIRSVAQHLQVDAAALEKAIVTRVLNTRGEVFTVPQNNVQATAHGAWPIAHGP